MTCAAITAERLAEARDRVARKKRVQAQLAGELIAEIERLRADLAAAYREVRRGLPAMRPERER